MMFGVISVGEYLGHCQPEVAARLWRLAGGLPGPGIKVVVSVSWSPGRKHTENQTEIVRKGEARNAGQGQAG